jgi:hypothetical protein
MKRIQIERKRSTSKQASLEPLPLDPRDELVVRAKKLARERDQQKRR